MYACIYTYTQKLKKSAENKAYLGFSFNYGKRWRNVNLISFRADGIFFTQNTHIIFYFDHINVLQ